MSETPSRPPLADRLRPERPDGFFGQRHLLGPGMPLRHALDSGRAHSMLLWGPPGTGKTTLARMLARSSNAQFLSVSAVLTGVKEIRAAVDKATTHRAATGRDTIFFVDEVHRFNRAQQDAFLPYVEDGTVVFVGATTENPSFEVNDALLSRVRVYVLEALAPGEIRQVIDRALAMPDAPEAEMTAALRDELAAIADGDARRALNLLELMTALAGSGGGPAVISEEILRDAVTGATLRRFDKGGEQFYDQISAVHKSIRGSDPDAALYWVGRMLDGGCDPIYVARRLVRIASEDIGNADPRALRLALDAWEVVERLGHPEGELALAQAAVYLACAAKSNAVYRAFDAAMKEVRDKGSRPVPMHLRNAPTRLMGELGHGKEYRYAHDEPEAYAAGESYFPDGVGQRRYYAPAPRGLEIRIGEKLARLRELDRRYRVETRRENEDG